MSQTPQQFVASIGVGPRILLESEQSEVMYTIIPVYEFHYTRCVSPTPSRVESSSCEPSRYDETPAMPKRLARCIYDEDRIRFQPIRVSGKEETGLTA